LNTKAGAQLKTADSGLVSRWQSRDLSQLIQNWADGGHVIRDQIVVIGAELLLRCSGWLISNQLEQGCGQT